MDERLLNQDRQRHIRVKIRSLEQHAPLDSSQMKHSKHLELFEPQGIHSLKYESHL